MSRVPPTAVLSDALAEAIAGRRVRAAVFTTYSFDPGFFEENVLPLLFDRPFSQVSKVRMIQLEDALRTVDEVAVYYDRAALAQEAAPARLDVRRIDVRRDEGVFHPKVILLLLDESMEQETDEAEESARATEAEEGVRQALVVGVLSANLTRSGWWESVEVFHFEEIPDKDASGRRCSFRADLLAFVRQIRRSAIKGEDHGALDTIHEFLRTRVNTEEVVNRSSKSGYYTQLYYGQSRLAEWLSDFRFAEGYWNLEVVSPFFDAQDRGTLTAIIDAVHPRAVRVYLPRDAAGAGEIAPELYNAVSEIASWGTLPATLTRRAGGRTAEAAVPRGVHAKIYRLWNADGNELVLAGSPNLTRAGHAQYRYGNLEAAFLVDVSESSRQQGWWIEALDREVRTFVDDLPEEDDASQDAVVDVSFRFNWERRCLAYYLHGAPAGPIRVSARTGERLFEIEVAVGVTWTDLGAEPARLVERLLASSSFLEVAVGESRWRVLVREEKMTYRPSLLQTLTPEEILLYWSLLSPAQREAFLAEKMQAEAQLEGLPSGGASRQYVAGETIFDRFAGRFHAFECLKRHVRSSVAFGRPREAEARLFGEKYDSLPALLEKVSSSTTEDPVLAYVTFLCARQVCDEIRREHPQLWEEHPDGASRLDARLAALDIVRQRVPVAPADAQRGFLEWYETAFLRRIEQPSLDGEDSDS